VADNVTVDNGSLTDYVVSADEGSGGQVQRVKLAYSSDGAETHVTADADGLLVNLGANNDITGTVTANLGATDNAVLDDIAADTEAIKTAVEILDNTVAGSELQVDVLTMPTTTITGVVTLEGSDTLAAARVNVTTASGEAVAARATRERVTLHSLPTNTAAIDIGASGVASGAGFPLMPGESLTLNTSAAVHADAASGTQVLAYIEEYE
jgi:hypothetical protein